MNDLTDVTQLAQRLATLRALDPNGTMTLLSGDTVEHLEYTLDAFGMCAPADLHEAWKASDNDAVRKELLDAIDRGSRAYVEFMQGRRNERQ